MKRYLLPLGGDIELWSFNGYDKNKETVVLIHGWQFGQESIKEPFDIGNPYQPNITKLMVDDFINDYQVLFLNWSEASTSLDPVTAAGRILPVVSAVGQKLAEITANITLIGHSLGSYVAGELAGYLLGEQQLITLDPAFPKPAYDLNLGNSIIDLIDDQRTYSNNSLSLVVSDGGDNGTGISGDNDYAKTANTSFIVNFLDPIDVEAGHGAVQDVYNDLLGNLGTPNSQTYKDFLSAFPKNQYDNSGQLVNVAGEFHEGVINVVKDSSDIWRIQSIEGNSLTYLFGNNTFDSDIYGYGGIVNNTGTLNISSGNGDTWLERTTLNNSGVIVDTHGDYFYFYDGTINNTGTYQKSRGILGDYYYYYYGDDYGTSAFNNSSKFEKIGSETAQIYIPFNNTNGTVEVKGGTLYLGGGGTNNNSSYIVANGTGLTFNGGTHNFEGNISILANGNIDNSATLNINANGVINLQGIFNNEGTIIDNNSNSIKFANGTINNSGNYQLKSATLENISGTNAFNNSGTFQKIGSETATINIPFNSNNGTVAINEGTLKLSGGGTNSNSNYSLADNTTLIFEGEIGINNSYIYGGIVNNTGTLNISGDSESWLQTTLNNSGTIVDTHGDYFYFYDGTINNTGTYQKSRGILGDYYYYYYGDDYGTSAFNNSSKFEKIGSETAQTYIPFNNTNGTVEVKGGTLYLGGGSTNNNSSYIIADGTNLTFGDGTHNFEGNISILANGNIDNSATLNINANGVINLQGIFNNGGAIVDNNSNSIKFANGTINNSGNYQLKSATFENTSGNNAFNNSGTFRKIGSETATINIPFNNTGTVEINQGTLKLSGGGTSNNSSYSLEDNTTLIFEGEIGINNSYIYGGIVNNTGTLNISGDSESWLQTTLNNSGTIVDTHTDYSYFYNGTINNSGTYQKSSGILYNFSGTNAFNNSGKFEKIGSESAEIYLPFNNTNGTVEIEQGILNINSTYTANKNSTIEININGLNNFGKLDFNTSVNLTGNLDINLAANYTPKAGDRFQIIDYNSGQGKFNLIDYTINPNLVFIPEYNSDNLTLLVVNNITGTNNNDTLNGTGNTLNNRMTGNSGNNRLNGGDGNDTLNGGAGDDTLSGGTGADSLTGGTGNDLYGVDNTGDSVVEALNGGTDSVNSSITYILTSNVENLTLTGTTAINGTGNSFNNIITGNSANNTLNGGGGVDTLIGGKGNDVYVIDTTTDTITENLNEGTDTVQSSVTYTLGNNLENLTLTGTTAINGIGNTLNNTIIGNTANNTLNGLGGIDTLIGGKGNDVYVIDTTTDTITENLNEGTDTVQSSVTYTLGNNLENLTLTGITAINGIGNTLNNIITGNSGNNRLDGGDGNDTLISGSGNDTLSGGNGNDSMVGGVGNDLYGVNTTGDRIVELANQGIDTVNSAITYTLGTNLENLTLTGTANINGIGNTLNNRMTGNSSNNRLDGGDGNDTLISGSGNDTLSGGNGNDSMIGGVGNDLYGVNTTGDLVVEALNGGTDSVNSSITYTLTSNVENLTLTSTTAINGTGNTLNNVITGNSGNNILTGEAGNDTLIGGAGNDTLIGGIGNDTLTGGVGNDFFRFNSTSEKIDRITDFNITDDTIQIVKSSFNSNLALGILSSSQFTIGASATTSAQRFFYNSSNGGLFFDSDGNGATSALQFATLNTGLALTNQDIVVI